MTLPDYVPLRDDYIVVRRLTLDVDYNRAKFDDSRFTRSRDI